MKFLKILLGIIVALVIVFFVAGLFLPKTYTMSRSIIINAPDSVIYNNIADFNNFKKWNPWYKMEPSAKITISGAPGQPGHQYVWEGDKTGMGQMLIKTIQPLKSVDEELKFIKPMDAAADILFTMEPAAGGVKVNWIMSGENKSTLNKWMGLTMDMMMGKDFENGLKDLKDLSEKR